MILIIDNPKVIKIANKLVIVKMWKVFNNNNIKIANNHFQIITAETINKILYFILQKKTILIFLNYQSIYKTKIWKNKWL